MWTEGENLIDFSLQAATHKIYIIFHQNKHVFIIKKFVITVKGTIPGSIFVTNRHANWRCGVQPDVGDFIPSVKIGFGILFGLGVRIAAATPPFSMVSREVAVSGGGGSTRGRQMQVAVSG